ncbi:MAG TPA: prepilin-type N-terminal cleavage/methylation domain-containing protein [Caulobacteraceae bacterium]|jgi:prepilin-type N-terminal cleavage/methylation domain-containing protein|nr:prepilin-type N-terminal cleavage/methylation domain-containing protein [Caulobacteraceae bacterium]
MRARGFALTELLVAVAIGGLIITVLTFLSVEYVGLGQRVSDLQGPYDLGRRVQADAAEDLCAHPGAVLQAGLDKVTAQSIRDASNALTLKVADGVSSVSGPGGHGGSSTQPVRIVVQSAASPGGSVASIEVGAATVGVVAPRCDLPEVCDYDVTNSLCKADEEATVGQSQ